jgi:hypothetical protein
MRIPGADDAIEHLARWVGQGRWKEECMHAIAAHFEPVHAQRETCEAFIKSQASEGWRLVKTHYDDGGISGAGAERSAPLSGSIRSGRTEQQMGEPSDQHQHRRILVAPHQQQKDHDGDSARDRPEDRDSRHRVGA